MTTTEKVRENKARRQLARRRYQLIKSRRRDVQAWDYGGYMIVDAETGGVILGSEPAFSLSLDDVEEFLEA